MARVPAIKSKRLFMKEITNDDLLMIHALDSLPEVERYNTIGIPKNPAATEKGMAPYLLDQKYHLRRFYCWKASLLKGEEEIGIFGLKCTADRFRLGEIWYKLFPEYWGQGYATEMGEVMLHFCLQTLHLHRVEAGVDIRNAASVRVLEKLGMTNEGIRRKILPIRGAWYDEYHFSLLEDDPVNLRPLTSS